MKIAVLLSGGVDSSVALRRLLKQGHTDLTAFYLKIWLEDEMAYMGSCPWEEDLSYARAVCRDVGVPLEVVSLQLEYYERVVQYAVHELRAGRTPSPDIFCNQRIKFGAFIDRIGPEFSRVATGHYARTRDDDGLVFLVRAPDPVKDQTYFLSHLSQAQMQQVLFPIGDLMKHEVRALAERLALPTMNRPDSQGICFLGKVRYPEFVRHYLGETAGEIRELESDRVLGGHHGFWFYTIGQRQGLGLGNGPWYVVAKDVEANIVYVSHRNHVEEAARDRFDVGELTWIAKPPDKTRLTCKLRHGPELTGCRIEWLQAEPRRAVGTGEASIGGGAGQSAGTRVASGVNRGAAVGAVRDGAGGADPAVRPASDEASGPRIGLAASGASRLRVTLDEPDRGVAPGQFAVFYDGEVCLGSGKILEA
jgi:tRNA-specific 2-thiouridylase